MQFYCYTKRESPFDYYYSSDFLMLRELEREGRIFYEPFKNFWREV